MEGEDGGRAGRRGRDTGKGRGKEWVRRGRKGKEKERMGKGRLRWAEVGEGEGVVGWRWRWVRNGCVCPGQ